MRAVLALLLALLVPVTSASAAMLESPKSASGISSGIWLQRTGANASQLADAHLEKVCGYDGVASGIVNDPVNLRDPTGMVATCWPWESQEDCSAKVLSELKSNSDANDEYYRTHGRSRLRDTAKVYTLGLAAMTAAPPLLASNVHSFVTAPLAYTAGLVGGELANQGAEALGIESPVVRFGLSMLGGMGASAVARGIRASILTSGSGALSMTDDVGRLSVAGPTTSAGGGPQTLYHYTTEAGRTGILNSGEIWASQGARNARYGAGQYFTDIAPEAIGGRTLASTPSSQMSLGQLSSRLFRVPWNTGKLGNFLEVDVAGLGARQVAPNIWLIEGDAALMVGGRVVRSGATLP